MRSPIPQGEPCHRCSAIHDTVCHFYLAEVCHFYLGLRILGEVRIPVERVALCLGWGEPHPRRQNSDRPEGTYLLAENLRRCSVSEALSGRAVQPVREGCQVVL